MSKCTSAITILQEFDFGPLMLALQTITSDNPSATISTQSQTTSVSNNAEISLTAEATVTDGKIFTVWL